MSNQILHFNSYPIESIEINGKKYISSANMSNALEYSTSKSITNLFNANREEFTNGEDYMVIDSMTVKNAPYKQTFFSIEGVILITMLAKTPKTEQKHRDPSYHITPDCFEYFRKKLVEKKPAELNK